MNGVFILLYNKMDVNIVRFSGGALIAGLYGPASRFQDVFGLLPAVLVTAAIPVASANAFDPAALQALCRRLTTIGLSLAIPLAIFVFFAADKMVDLALGSSYHRTAAAVRVLAFSIPFVAASGPRLAVLVAADRGKETATIYGCAFLTAAVAQVVLTRLGGVTGAAFGALSREPVLLLGSVIALRSLYSGPPSELHPETTWNS
jgi:O-antigen/teichoic acid export membrane protein